MFVLSRIYGSVTNNNGFGWLTVSTPFTISLNHNQLQQHNQSTAELFFPHCRGLAPFSFHSLLYYLYSLEADSEKTPLPLLFYLQRQKRKLSDCCLSTRCRGNVFTESLPSNGSTCHNIITSLIWIIVYMIPSGSDKFCSYILTSCNMDNTSYDNSYQRQ
jgi:hypothetical protein